MKKSLTFILQQPFWSLCQQEVIKKLRLLQTVALLSLPYTRAKEVNFENRRVKLESYNSPKTVTSYMQRINR